MTDVPEITSAELARAKINSETARILWKELQRFFASGKTLYVEAELDLVDVGFALQNDSTDRVQHWLDQEKVRAVSTEQARQWIEADAEVWAVVVKPWVLIQSIQ